MADNLIQQGNTLTWTNTSGSDVVAGQVVVVAQQIGVAIENIATNAAGELAMTGVFEVPKVSGAEIAQGESLVWDSSEAAFDDSQATPATGDVSGCCVAWEAASNGTTTVRAKLNVGVGTVQA